MTLVSTKAVTEAAGISAPSIPYAQQWRIPFTATPGGHRRFEIDAAVESLRSPPRTAPTLAALRSQRRPINNCAKRNWARSLRVFGSVAAGTAGPGSDVDFLVALDVGRTYGACHGRFANIPDLAVRL